jgi:cold shock CspA family protein
MRGIIARFIGSEDLFFHVKGCVGLPFGVKPNPRDRVEFDVVADPVNGKPRAQNVRLI